MRRALALALLLAACKSPSYSNGGLVCGASGDCPRGLHCAVDGTCWRNGEDPTPLADPDLAMSDPVDLALGGDVDLGSVGPDLAPVCGWSMSPTNFDACAAGVPSGDWIVTNGTYDTDSAGGASGPVGTVVQQSGGPMVRLLRVGRFNVPPGISLTIQGSMALIIAADTVDVAGNISVFDGTGGASCSVVVNGIAGTRCGSGGAGGAFGASGGAGGGCSGVTGPTGPSEIGNATLTPLFGGCPGGLGGGAGTATRGFPGGPGGALQISARVSLSVTGVINAGGGGGGGGIGTLSGCTGGGCASGGGGGGSGGAILLESPMVLVGGHVCANGGAGGGGGGNGNTTGAGGGGGATCADMPSTGGAGLSGGGGGQSGGHTAHPPGYDAVAITTLDGGGGGGGSVGRIRIRAANATPISIGAVVSPPPYLN